MESIKKLHNFLRAFICIAAGGLLYGYCIGINSNVVTQGQLLCEDGYTGPVGTWISYGYGQCYQLDSFAVGLLSSMNIIGACLSSLVCFCYADSLGRKLEVQLAGVLYLLGASVSAASSVLWGVYAGFLIYGLGIGFAMHAAPAYIAEISLAEVRGRFVSAKEALVVFGMVLGFLSGVLFSGIQTSGWRGMVASSCVLALAMLLGMAGVPQSPRFLVLQAVRRGDSTDEASAALQWFRRASAKDVEDELRTITEEVVASFDRGQVELDPSDETRSLLRDKQIKKKAGLLDAFQYRRPMVLACGLVILQQVTGQPSVLYFATNIMKEAGFGKSAALCSLQVGIVKLIATLFTVWQVDHYGRRPLLLAGILMMAVALSVMAGGFFFLTCKTPGASLADCNQSDLILPTGLDTAVLCALMLYVSGYQVGFGPIGWLMISEVFPLEVRGSALSVAITVNFVSNIVMTVSQASLSDAMSPAGLFLGYLGFTLFAISFTVFMVPETKGLSLEQIQTLMRS